MLGVLGLVLLMWFAPTVPVVLLGGFAVAMVLSFPVRWLSHLMPRRLAILATFLGLVSLGALALLLLVPILIAQLASLVKAAPDIAREANSTVRALLEPISQLGLLPGTPDQFMSSLGQDLVDLAQELAQQTLGGLVRFVSGAIGIALSLFGVLFVAVYLLANVRKLKAAFLVSSPKRYRQDAHQLWDAFAFSFSRSSISRVCSFSYCVVGQAQRPSWHCWKAPRTSSPFPSDGSPIGCHIGRHAYLVERCLDGVQLVIRRVVARSRISHARGRHRRCSIA
jgi:predicted PurR-regulated permease PerM